MDYEALILTAQERETHPELGVPKWGRPDDECDGRCGYDKDDNFVGYTCPECR